MVKKLRTIITVFRRADISLRNKIAVFFLASLITLLFGIMLVLTLMGEFSAGAKEIHQTLATEHSIVMKNIERTFGNISVKTVNLSKKMSLDIETFMRERGIRSSELAMHPELLAGLEERQKPNLLYALDSSEASGVFFILNATVNPSLPDAQYSRAGLYIRNAEPSSIDFKLFLRGFPNLVIERNITLQAKWDLEFNIKEKDFYNLPLEIYSSNPNLKLHHLYFWNFEDPINDGVINLVLCSVPVFDSVGNVLGICGFEYSEQNFRSTFDNSKKSLPGMIYIISSYENYEIRLDKALFSGNYQYYANLHESSLFVSEGNKNELEIFKNDTVPPLIGLHDTIEIYAKGSPFETQVFSVVTAIPKSYYDETLRTKRQILGGIFVFFVGVGILIALYMSKRLVQPITEQMERIKNDVAADQIKTNIPEIDLLLKHLLKSYSAGKEINGQTELLHNFFAYFMAAVKTLTPTELVLFQYYADGKSSNEIKELMFISEGTFRVHSTHIYQKLNVSNKNELMVYVDLIKKSGKYAYIFSEN